MNGATTTRYSVQRQASEGEEWAPVSSCNSMLYARMVASTGLRRHVGVCYRLVDNRTGHTTTLFPELRQKAA